MLMRSRGGLAAMLLLSCASPAPVFDVALSADTPRRAIDLGVTPTYATPGPSVSIAIADFDGDGRPDVAAVGPSYGGVVLRGRGDGSLGEARTVFTGPSPQAIVTGDFDGDGHPDLAVAFQDGAGVLWGQGDGTFPLAATYPVGAAPSAIAVGDFDGDGHLDLALANGSDVSILRGTGGRGFAPAVRYPAIAGATWLFAADFDGDGKLDLHARNKARCVTLYGAESGTFRGGPIQDNLSTAGTYTTAVAVGDLDGDGKAEVVTAAHEHEDEWVWNITLDYKQRPTALELGDLDGDGLPDLLAGVSCGGTLLTVLGNGDLSFRGGDYFGLRGVPHAIATADLDGDGKLDVVAVGDGVSGVNVLLGYGDGTFRGERAVLVPRSPRRVVAGDLNGDGLADAVVTSADYDDRYDVYLADRAGRFRHASGGSLGPAYAGAQIALVDVNGDGKLDLLSADSAVVMLGNGDGSFQPLIRGSKTHLRSFVLGDVDGDHKPDVLLQPGSASALLLLSNGDGTFQPERAIDLSDPIVGTADLDGDGKLDLVVPAQARLGVRFGRGDGTFDPARALEDVAEPGPIAIADWNYDGRPDLAVAHADGTVSVLLGDGARGFRSPVVTVAGKGIAWLAARDVDGDGRPDLLAASASLLVLAGNGDGTFEQPRGFDVGGDEIAIADSDGLPDLFVLQKSNRFLRVVRNTSR